MLLARRALAALVLAALAAAPAGAATIAGTLYADTNASSLTDLRQSVDPGDCGLGGVEVTLYDADLVPVTTTTDAEGRWAFEAPIGAYLVVPATPAGAGPATSHNLAPGLAAALADPPFVYVALGDSTGVVGDKTPYPARLAAILGQLTQVDLRNRAVPGSETVDWLPGTSLLAKAEADLAAADLVTITIGGNDLQNAIGGDPAKALDVAGQAIENVGVILDAVRELNPTAAIVVTLYPNYTLAESKWSAYVSASLLPILQSLMEAVIDDMRLQLAARPDVVLADCFESFVGLDMDAYLSDPIHPNGAGHQLYAETVARSLGMVFVLGADLDPPARDVGLDLAACPEPPGPEPQPDAADDASAPDAADDAASAEDVGPADDAAPADAAAPDTLGEAGPAPAATSDEGCAGGPTPPAFPLLALLALAALATRRRRAPAR